MAKEDLNKTPETEQSEEKILDFDHAKEMTVGEVEQKDKENQVGITENDDALDKYIKMHRQEIDSDKFDQLDEAVLSSQVEKDENPNEDEVRQEKATFDDRQSQPATPEKNTSVPSRLEMDTLEATLSDSPEDKKGSIKKPVIVLLIAIAVVLIALLAYFSFGRSQTNTSKSKQETTTQSADKETKKDLNQFNQKYKTFFVDDKETKLKNSEFSELSSLKTLLDKLRGTDDYKTAEKKYEVLSDSISAIKEINNQFDSAVIKDGSLQSDVTVKKDATFKTPDTGNSTLDSLIKEAIALGKNQLSEETTTSSSTSSKTSTTTSSTNSSTTPSTSSNPSTSPSTSTTTSDSTTSSGVTLQRSKSRVPYNQSAINDSSNSAWTFNPGVLEKIVATSQERGYITGNNYILEKVNIINGNGYYNMFKPDGTYLFSINDKTGYFVGNAAGHSNNLDY